MSDAKALMFPIGTWARAHPSLVEAMKRDGQVIDNHTATHADLSTASTSTVLREIDHGARPSTPVWLLRPPGGAGDPAQGSAATRSGTDTSGPV